MSTYCMNVTSDSTFGEWEPCKAKTLAGAKREASARYGDGFRGHVIQVAEYGLQSERRYEHARKTIGGSGWTDGRGYA